MACARCATPLGSDERTCPMCGTAVAASRRPAVAATGRRVLLDAPVPPAPAQVPRGATAPRPAARPALRRSPARRPAAGPDASGTIAGDVAVGGIEPRAWGGRPLAWAAVALAAGAALALVGLGGVAFAVATLWSRLVPAAVLVVLLLGHRLLVVLVRRRAPASEQRRFRVVAPDGSTTDAAVVGALEGGSLVRGDVVDLFGRLRAGVLLVAEAVVPARAERVRGRLPLAFPIVRSAVAVPAAVAAVCAGGVLWALLVR